MRRRILLGSEVNGFKFVNYYGGEVFDSYYFHNGEEYEFQIPTKAENPQSVNGMIDNVSLVNPNNATEFSGLTLTIYFSDSNKVIITNRPGEMPMGSGVFYYQNILRVRPSLTPNTINAEELINKCYLRFSIISF